MFTNRVNCPSKPSNVKKGSHDDGKKSSSASVSNSVSADRVKEVGPDRACAEWLLRNGGRVQWKGEKDFVSDYNQLPLSTEEKYKNNVFLIKAADATDATIMSNGFPHFNGCKHVDTIILKRCHLLCDEALPYLSLVESTLKSLEIASCSSITDKGLLSLVNLRNLKELNLNNLDGMKDEVATLQELRKGLPSCIISLNGKTGGTESQPW